MVVEGGSGGGGVEREKGLGEVRGGGERECVRRDFEGIEDQ